jgi:hypothetical protein
VNRGLRNSLQGPRDVGRGIALFLLLVGGSAALGFVIAWPLWLFATSARTAYTVFVLCLVGAGIVALVARNVARRRRAARDRGAPRRAALSVLVTIIQVVVVLAGLWAEAAFVVRGFWVMSVAGLLVWGAILWALGMARRAAKRRKQPAIPAENKGE